LRGRGSGTSAKPGEKNTASPEKKQRRSSGRACTKGTSSIIKRNGSADTNRSRRLHCRKRRRHFPPPLEKKRGDRPAKQEVVDETAIGKESNRCAMQKGGSSLIKDNQGEKKKDTRASRVGTRLAGSPRSQAHVKRISPPHTSPRREKGKILGGGPVF